MSKLEKIEIGRKKAAVDNKKAKAQRVPIGKKAPIFQTLFQPDDANPLDGIEYPGDVEGNASTEVSEILSRIKEEKAKAREQYRVTTDVNFYCCLCFQSESQKDEFLEKAGWKHLGAKFLDGVAVAKLLDVDVRPILLEAKQTKAMPVKLRGVKFIE